MPSTTAIAKLTEVQDKVLETIDQVQEPIVSTVRDAAAKAESRMPELPALPFADKLPPADELVANQFAFAAKLLEQQKSFVEALLDAARPVSEKLVVVEDDAKAKTSTKKAA